MCVCVCVRMYTHTYTHAESVTQTDLCKQEDDSRPLCTVTPALSAAQNSPALLLPHPNTEQPHPAVTGLQPP